MLGFLPPYLHGVPQAEMLCCVAGVYIVWPLRAWRCSAMLRVYGGVWFAGTAGAVSLEDVHLIPVWWVRGAFKGSLEESVLVFPPSDMPWLIFFFWHLHVRVYVDWVSRLCDTQ
ncbi:hypothetical protein DQ04_02031140 [Trypanosoma grayi]|uniref:hypothetical protein n=1 Tax=Trypanosoma grayi TaxID=71804 RepID=UPI0004F42046|nr:hypothetical protein DQ04_02031140 [Trypanosoma grayi]KEG12072.1 hypothetical protein DQ04_02031140 [Trypanosoma grayi]